MTTKLTFLIERDVESGKSNQQFFAVSIDSKHQVLDVSDKQQKALHK